MLQLLALHALCDYPLQGDFMARAKNRHSSLPGVPWWIVLASHAAIHAGAVSLVAPLWCACLEFSAHMFIDFAKNEGWFGKGETAFIWDQAGHVLCKLNYAVFS